MNRGQQFVDRLVAWSPVLLLGGLAALTYWLDAQVQIPPARPDASKRHAADIFIDNFRGESFDAEGRLRQSLGARRAQHYADDDTIDFASPTIALSDPDQPRIVVTADAGSLSGDRETVNFKGNVHATRDADAAASGNASGADAQEPSKGVGPITVLADTLRVVPKQGTASTDGPVTIEEPRGIIHAVGMDFDNQAHSLKLRSTVRGTLQPHVVENLPKQ
jgi:lipopolysaccharide export system protein LptC